MKKKWFSLLMATLMLGACTACGDTVVYGEEAPTYVSDKEFYIGMWIGVPSSLKEYDDQGRLVSNGRLLTEEDYDYHYKLIADAGFNYVEPGLNEYTEAYNMQVLKAAQKYNLHQYLNDVNILNLLLDTTQDEEVVETKLTNFSQKYMAYDSFAGLKIRDEPNFSQIAGYAQAKKRFDKVFGKDKIFYMNLVSSIAAPSALGSSYQDYVKEYVNQIGTDYVSYDHYPLKTDPKGQNYILEIFLDNMEQVKEAAPDKDIWTFLQSIQYSPNNRTLTSVADTTFQMYSFLAYGGAGIQWFCYWSPPAFSTTETFGESCIGRDGQPTEIYDYVKAANLEIRSFEDIYLNFEWQGVMTKIGTDNEEGGENACFNYLNYKVMSSHERIKSFKTQQDTLTGVFKDKEGRDGFMIVNYTEPSAGLKNKVELEFNDCTHALVVKKGKTKEVKAKNGKISFTMNAGEGYFVIPLR